LKLLRTQKKTPYPPKQPTQAFQTLKGKEIIPGDIWLWKTMLSFFNPSFETFFFLKRRFPKLTNCRVPQMAMIATIKAAGVDRGRKKGERERKGMCLQALPSLSLGAAQTAHQVWMECCSEMPSPPWHRCFQPSGSYCWSTAGSASTHSFSCYCYLVLSGNSHGSHGTKTQ